MVLSEELGCCLVIGVGKRGWEGAKDVVELRQVLQRVTGCYVGCIGLIICALIWVGLQSLWHGLHLTIYLHVLDRLGCRRCSCRLHMLLWEVLMLHLSHLLK